jgi:hypothetical protein
MTTLKSAAIRKRVHAVRPIAAEVVERAMRFIQQLEDATEATDLVRLFATPSLIR